MIKFEMKFNGKRITSGNQLGREMKKSVDRHVERSLRKAAGPSVHLKKTSSGYVAEGTPEAIDRMKQRLSR